jgi:hypothetical protein
MRRIAVAAALCFAAACGTDPSAPPTESSAGMGPGPEGMFDASLTCQNVDRNDPDLTPLYRCGDKVRVTGTDTALTNAITPAIAIWNSVVFGQAGLPVFVPSGTAQHVVTVSFSSQGTWFCGTTDPNGTTITIFRSSTQFNCNGGFTNVVQRSGLHRLIAHELSHAIGFKHISAAGFLRPAADHCVASLPQSGGLNGSLCQAEIEMLRYNYGLRDTDVDPSKHIATGLEVSGPTSLNPGQSGTFTVNAVFFARAAPSFTPPSPSLLKFAWSVDNPAIATLGSSINATNTVQAVSAGTTKIHIRLTSSIYEKAEPFGGGDITFTVVAPPTPPPPPTGLTASAVTFSSATIGWVNGATNTGTTTTLQYRQSGAATWTTASSTIAAGVTTFGLSGLTSLKTYDVRAFHVRNGLSSTITTAAGLFSTPAVPPLPPITNFHVTSCEQRVTTKTHNYFALAWNSDLAPAGSSIQIGVNTTSSSAGAAVIVTYPLTARTGEVGGYLSSPLLASRWFWIRYIRSGLPGPWFSLVGNPLATNQCAL